MTDAKYRETKRRVSKLLDRWVKPLGLGYWTGKNLWCDEPIPSTAGEGVALAVASVQWEYLEYSIQWNCPGLAELDDEELETVVVHELCHVLVAELQYEKAQCHVERVVTTLQKAFLWVRAQAKRDRL